MRKGSSLAIAIAILLGFIPIVTADAQEQPKPGAKAAGGASHSKRYTLPATAETVQWGWFDVNEKPKLTIESGDTVSIETWYHALDKIKPTPEDHTLNGPSMDELGKLRKENDGGGPHSITGPIYVNGAEPGDTLEIRILKIVPKEYAQNFNLPGKLFPTGLLPSDFPEGFVRYYKLDLVKNETEFKPGIMLDLRPFPGVIAVGPDPNEPKEKAGPPIKDDKGRTSTLRPWKNGSNMDLNELRAGSTLYLPVFEKGALIWTGDSHCRQGNGEVNLEALECAYEEIVYFVPGMRVEWSSDEILAHQSAFGDALHSRDRSVSGKLKLVDDKGNTVALHIAMTVLRPAANRSNTLAVDVVQRARRRRALVPDVDG